MYKDWRFWTGTLLFWTDIKLTCTKMLDVYVYVYIPLIVQSVRDQVLRYVQLFTLCVCNSIFSSLSYVFPGLNLFEKAKLLLDFFMPQHNYVIRGSWVGGEKLCINKAIDEENGRFYVFWRARWPPIILSERLVGSKVLFYHIII